MSVSLEIKQPDQKLSKFNNFLTVVVVLLGIYLIAMPLLPKIAFWLKQKTGQTPTTVVYSSDPDPSNGTKPIPSDNRLVIPQMGLDATVNEGAYASTLSKGVWHRPKSSSPDKGGNTVLVGHRFTYRSSAIFYHLDKLKKGDEFALFWSGKEYRYRVRDIQVVAPTQIQIENNTTEPILTLYTCTPMWTSKQRLVVISDLIKDGNL